MTRPAIPVYQSPRAKPANGPANGGAYDPGVNYTVIRTGGGSGLAAPGTTYPVAPVYNPGPPPGPPQNRGLFGELGPILLIQAAMNAVKVLADSKSAAGKVEAEIEKLAKMDPIGGGLPDTIVQLEQIKAAVKNLAVVDQQSADATANWARLDTLVSGMLDQMLSGNTFGAGNSAIQILIFMQVLGMNGGGGLFGNLFGGGTTSRIS